MQKNILICGMGVIGSIYALRLAKAGHNITCLARGGRLDSLRSKGLVIRNILVDEQESAQVTVSENVPSGSKYDIILITVRSGQIMDILGQLKEKSISAQAVTVIGNNLEDLSLQTAMFGREKFVAGFGAFGGYRKDDIILYLDGRTAKKNKKKLITPTTLGIIDKSAGSALKLVRETLAGAGCRVSENPDIQSWFYYHAALVFPLAGAMYAAGGNQQRFCRTRDVIILGVRACHECFRALKAIEYRMQPKSIKILTIMPEWLLIPILAKRMNGIEAETAMFGHANAPGGRDEISNQALVFNKIISKADKKLSSWEMLLPFFVEKNAENLIPDASRKLRFRIW